jgi:protein-S-isoprenylcysteine O-methyltransferase Ste14
MQPKIKARQLIGYLFIFVAAPILTLVFGFWIDLRLDLPTFPSFPLNLFLGMIVIIIGLNLGIKSTRQLYHAGLGLPWGEAVHSVESSRLVVDGIYAYSRNPMVLGYSLLPFGMGLMFQSIGMAFSLTPVVFLLNIILVKKREEPRLLDRFGDYYRKYQEQTPFLFPNLSNLIRNFLVPYFKSNKDQISYIVLAELSLLIASMVVFQDFPDFLIPYNKLIVKLLFATICVLGILAGGFPKTCNLSHKSKSHSSIETSGHHPNCGHFSNHTVNVGGRILCAGCNGLIFGAVFTLLGLFSGLYPFKVEVGFWFGALLVSLGLAQHLIDLGSGWVHFWLNFWFVVGVWFMFEAMQLMSLSFLASVYFLTVVIFWIFARIRISQWTHVAICRACDEVCTHRYE